MSRLPVDSIGNGYASDHCWSVLEDLVAIRNRMAGHEGEKEGARVVADAFSDAGLRDVETSEFEIPGWWRGSSSIEIYGPRRTFADDHEVIALPGGPSGDVEAQLVDLGHGMPEEIGEEVAGKIAMVRSDSPPGEEYVHRMVKYATVADAGAVGFVYRNHVEGCLPPTGNVRFEHGVGPIPAVGVSKETGAQLAQHCERSDGPVTGGLAVDCRHDVATSVNTHGVVGPDTDEVVLVTAHVDAHDIATGAMDNGVATALVTEIARLLARSPEHLDTRVEYVVFGAEEVGLLGAQCVADQMDLDDVKCVLNIDGAGRSRDVLLKSNGFTDVAEAVRAVADDLGVPLSTDDEILPHTDAWRFCEEGVPAVTAASDSSGEGRGRGHTHADTLDKLDRRDLRELALILANVAIELAEDDREFPGSPVPKFATR